jgi:hypothetical protein
MKPIIVVGAGPVGLTTALGLHFYGLPFQLFEEDAALSNDTKAGTVLTRTLEAFRRYGVADRVLAKALRVDEIGDIERASNTARPSVRTDLLTEDTCYPFIINMPQHHLEMATASARGVICSPVTEAAAPYALLWALRSRVNRWTLACRSLMSKPIWMCKIRATIRISPISPIRTNG